MTSGQAVHASVPSGNDDVSGTYLLADRIHGVAELKRFSAYFQEQHQNDPRGDVFAQVEYAVQRVEERRKYLEDLRLTLAIYDEFGDKEILRHHFDYDFSHYADDRVVDFLDDVIAIVESEPFTSVKLAGYLVHSGILREPVRSDNDVLTDEDLRSLNEIIRLMGNDFSAYLDREVERRSEKAVLDDVREFFSTHSDVNHLLVDDFNLDDFKQLLNRIAELNELCPRLSFERLVNSAYDIVIWERHSRRDHDQASATSITHNAQYVGDTVTLSVSPPDDDELIETANACGIFPTVFSGGVEIDLSHEESRVYRYVDENGKDSHEIVIDCPATLFAANSGYHYIVDVANVGSIVPPGWAEITTYPLYGYSPFGAELEADNNGEIVAASTDVCPICGQTDAE